MTTEQTQTLIRYCQMIGTNVEKLSKREADSVLKAFYSPPYDTRKNKAACVQRVNLGTSVIAGLRRGETEDEIRKDPEFAKCIVEALDDARQVLDEIEQTAMQGLTCGKHEHT